MKRRIEKIVLIEPRAPGIHTYSGLVVPRLGMTLLATIAKERLGYSDVTVYCEDIFPIDMPDVLSADMVVVSATTVSANAAYAICETVRKTGKTGAISVLCGMHATFMSDEAAQHADFVIQGEPQIAFTNLVDAIENNRENEIPQILAANLDNKSDLANTQPDLKLISGHQKIKVAPVLALPNGDNKSTYDLIKRYQGEGKDEIFFCDDNFNADVNSTKEFLTGMIRANCIPKAWSAQVKATEILQDKELIGLLKQTNCSTLYMGLENTNEAILKENNRKQSIDQVIAAIRILKEQKILTHGLFVFGSDTDTVESLRETTDFVIRNDISTVQFMILTPLPGTQYFNQLDSQGRIFDKNWDRYDALHTVFHPKNMSAHELQTETINAMERVVEPSRAIIPLFSLNFRTPANRRHGHGVLEEYKRRSIEWMKSLPKQVLPESSWLGSPTETAISDETRFNEHLAKSDSLTPSESDQMPTAVATTSLAEGAGISLNHA